MNWKGFGFALLAILIITGNGYTKGQSVKPQVLTEGTLKEQMDYILEKTKIYDGYRAISEDLFQKMIGNFSDTLKKSRSEIANLQNGASTSNRYIDSLNMSLEKTGTRLNQVTESKDSITFLGLELSKAIYNTVVWILIAFLGGLAIFCFLAFKRNISITRDAKNDLEDLKKEFEAYRKASREAREKMSMAHFNEIKKLRNG